MNSKVIDFELELQNCKSTPHRNAIMRKFAKERRKVTAFASLAAVLLLVTIANISLLSQKDSVVSHYGREIASVDVESRRATTLEDARNLLRKIESRSERSPASLGTAPSLIDNLRFGVLEGKYALRMTNGKLSEIEFVDTAQVEDRPKYIAEAELFLKEYKTIMGVEYDRVAKLDEAIIGEQVHQTYQLLNQDGTQVGEAQFVRDNFGRLLNFKLVRTISNK